jgi:hypothetical protein
METNDFTFWLQIGLSHITDINAYDHLLFIAAMCSVFSFSEIKKVLIMITAFTVGHSISLVFTVGGYSFIAPSTVEFLIPVSILLTTVLNLINKSKNNLDAGLMYFVILFFGLIHGLGFAGYLKSLLGKSGDFFVPLMSFNIGLEVGQALAGGLTLFLIIILEKLHFSRRDIILLINAFIIGVTLTLLQKVWIF